LGIEELLAVRHNLSIKSLVFLKQNNMFAKLWSEKDNLE